jgi:hypothetical protein
MAFDSGLPTSTRLEVVGYEPWHLREIALQPHQEHLGAFLRDGDHAERVALVGPCWTALANGRPICCAGFNEFWEGRSEAWAILSRDAGKHMVWLTRQILQALDVHPAERIEAKTEAGAAPSARWAALLGFECEGPPLRRYYKGRDYLGFVRLRSK